MAAGLKTSVAVRRASHLKAPSDLAVLFLLVLLVPHPILTDVRPETSGARGNFRHPHIVTSRETFAKIQPRNVLLGRVSAFETTLKRQQKGDAKRSMPIYGSRIAGGDEALAFRQRWDCLTSLRACHWSFNPLPRPLGWAPEPFGSSFRQNPRWQGPYGTEVNDKVRRGEYNITSWSVPPNVKYDWVLRDPEKEQCGSKQPAFQRLDPLRDLCSFLQRIGGSVFIIGDSLSAEFLLALIGELGASGILWQQMEPTESCKRSHNAESAKPGRYFCGLPPICIRYMACGGSPGAGGVVIHFVQSCYLWAVHESNSRQQDLFNPVPSEFARKDFSEDVREPVWGEEMVLHNASLVILNRGAHVTPSPLFEKQLIYTISELRNMLPNLLIVYRSFYTALPHCSRFYEPLTEPNETALPYNWDIALSQNFPARLIVEEAGGLFLDVQAMLSVRQDWHRSPDRDCLHNILPGPTNSVVRLVCAMLVELL